MANPAGSWSSVISSLASANSTTRADRDRRDAASEIHVPPRSRSLWGQRYPDAAYHLVTSTPDAIEAIGGDELLYADG